MLVKYRVHEVARDFEQSNNKEIIDVLQKYTGEVKKHQTALTEDELNIVFEHFTQSAQVKNFDAYFALGADAKKQREEQAKQEQEARLKQQAEIAEQLLRAAKEAKDQATASPEPTAPEKAEEKPADNAVEKTEAVKEKPACVSSPASRFSIAVSNVPMARIFLLRVALS